MWELKLLACGYQAGGQGHGLRRCIPLAGCPERDPPPSHNQGTGLLKRAPTFPLSSFTLPWALPSRPSHLSPGSLGLTALLLGELLAVLLGLPVFTLASGFLGHRGCCCFPPGPSSLAVAFLAALVAQTGFLTTATFMFAAAFLVAFSLASQGETVTKAWPSW